MLVDDFVTLALATQAALEVLPESQRRRYLLHHLDGLSFAEIGRLENCSKQAIAQSVSKAESGIKIFFDEGG
jgi:DNA-directed RNA polymerase specialized sigma24 family protein